MGEGCKAGGVAPVSTSSMTASNMIEAKAGTATLNMSASNGELSMPPADCAATELPSASGLVRFCAASAVGASSRDEQTCAPLRSLPGALMPLFCCLLRTIAGRVARCLLWAEDKRTAQLVCCFGLAVKLLGCRLL